MNRLTVVVLGTFTAILLISGGLAYVLRDQTKLENAAVTSDAGVAPVRRQNHPLGAQRTLRPKIRSRPAAAQSSASYLGKTIPMCIQQLQAVGNRRLRR